MLRVQENADAPIETLLDPNVRTYILILLYVKKKKMLVDYFKVSAVLFAKVSHHSSQSFILCISMLQTFAADGTAALSSYSISDAGRYLAYAVSRSGSDWCTIHVRDIATRKDLSDDKLEWVKFSSLSFDAAERGFFYCRYPAPRSLENGSFDVAIQATFCCLFKPRLFIHQCNQSHRVLFSLCTELDESKRGQEVDAAASQSLYYHRIGTPQSEDVLIVNTPEQPTWMFGAEVTDDGRYCVITVVDGCDPVNKVWLLDMQLPGNDPNQAKDGFKVGCS